MKNRLLTLVFLLFMPLSQANDSVFQLSMMVDNAAKNYGFANAEEMFDRFDGVSLSNEFPGYISNVSAVNSQIDYRGLTMLMSYAVNSSVLVFSIPELNILETFDGNGNRDTANDMFVDFLKGEGDNIINLINKRLAQRSPVDPFAGNPTSMMGAMVSASYNQGTAVTRNQANIAPSSNAAENLLAAGLQFGSMTQAGTDVDVWNLPLSYTWAEEDGHNLTFKMPISMVDAAGSKSYKIGLGLAYQKPMSDKWLLTPAFEYGLMGSEDLLSGGQLISLSLTSLYTFDRVTEGVSISMGNMAGYYKTLPTKIGDVDIDPDITSQVLKNGIIVDTKADMFGTEVNVQYFLSDTRFFGDNLYAEHYNEVGLSITPVKKGGIYNYLGLTFSYLWSSSAEDIDGLKVGLVYTF